jgi:hypothetical protein
MRPTKCQVARSYVEVVTSLNQCVCMCSGRVAFFYGGVTAAGDAQLGLHSHLRVSHVHASMIGTMSTDSAHFVEPFSRRGMHGGHASPVLPHPEQEARDTGSAAQRKGRPTIGSAALRVASEPDYLAYLHERAAFGNALSYAHMPQVCLPLPVVLLADLWCTTCRKLKGYTHENEITVHSKITL